MLVGVVGKTNVGKSTFFKAATLIPVAIDEVPFTTIKPNRGMAAVRVPCVCRDLGVKDEPRNSKCIDGNRFIPVEMLDVAGLVKGAWRGRGLGNQFLDDLRQADAFIHVVDAAGSTDEDGNLVPPGSRDPLDDVKEIQEEITMWIASVIKRDWEKSVRTSETLRGDPVSVLSDKLAGLSVSRGEVVAALEKTGLVGTRLSSWREEEIRSFASAIYDLKPKVVAANKADIREAEANIESMRRSLSVPVIPTIAEAEVALRLAAEKGLIDYLAGDSSFRIRPGAQLTSPQQDALKRIQQMLEKWGNTGVQQAINEVVLKQYGGIVVYPVEDVNKYSDSKGRVLPDAYIVPPGTTPREFAYKIHTDLGEGYLYAVDAVTKQRLPEDKPLKNRAVIKIVSSKRRFCSSGTHDDNFKCDKQQ
ncbi:MAG: redox-regulated ATPase YchF [Thermoprotei archaeon]